MGPSRGRDQKLAQDDLKAQLREKEDQIAALEARLEAYSARASTAQTRLLKTIDVLDALRAQHALEISAEEQAKSKLVHELDCLRTVAKNLEVERDELRDVVEDLIEKAAFTSLNMRQADLNVDFLEQGTVCAIDGGRTAKEDTDNELLAYATSIIARLRTELDFERHSHRKSVEEANIRIEELEAKVAVREAELENHINSPGDHQGLLRESHASKTDKLPEPKPLSDEECLRFLESNNTRNRSLEIEIRQLAEKLAQARLAASSQGGSYQECQSPALRNGYKAMPSPGPRARSVSIDPNILSRPVDLGKATSTPGSVSPSTALSIAQLDNQIRVMATQVDALVSERTTLIEAAARQRRVTHGTNIDVFQDILQIEGECVRLQAEVDRLRDLLQHERIYARDRERALLRQITQLRASSPNLSTLRSTPGLHQVFSPQPLEADIPAEESMELASPILPTIVPDRPPAPLHDDAHSEIDLVPFPFPLKTMSSPTPTVPTIPARSGHRSPGPLDVEAVQAALDAARTHLAQKEKALAQLRVEMEKLRREMQAQTRTHGSDSGNDKDGDMGEG